LDLISCTVIGARDRGSSGALGAAKSGALLMKRRPRVAGGHLAEVKHGEANRAEG
jgi:hypothetical protein